MQGSKDTELQRSILKTVAYADVFNYPLTDCEITRFLIGNTEVGRKTVRKTLLIFALARHSLDEGGDCGKICADKEFYFLKGREKVVELRKERKKWAKEKWAIVQSVVDRLKVIPTIKMVGVTGALAMENCKEDDDIDLLIITAKNSLWLTRFLIIILCPILGIRRRKPNDKNVKDKICFNLFLEENHLKIEPENLFLAHEIVQVKPIYDKNNTYERFQWENRWVRRYLPNTVIPSNSAIQPNYAKATMGKQFSNRVFIVKLLNCLIVVLNRIAYLLQFFYMKSRITCEKVSLHQAFFHPNNLQDKISSSFEERLRKMSLDKKRSLPL